SPSGSGGLAIAMVVESAKEPRLEEPGERTLRESSTGRDADSPSALARSYQALFSSILTAMESDRIAASDNPEGTARMADWVVRNIDLLAPDDSEERRSLRAEISRLAAAQESLARQLAVAAPTAPAMGDGTGVNEHL